MSNLRFAIWDGMAHVARSEAHDWTHALCNAAGGPTGETEFVEANDVREPVCRECLRRLVNEEENCQDLLSHAVSAIREETFRLVSAGSP